MLAMLLSDKVIVLTKEYQAELKFSLGWIYRDSKVSVVPNGIDVDLFSWRKSSVDRLRGPVINLGMAGRFSHSKRQDLLLDVLNYLRESRKDKSIMLHLAGDGELFEAIQKLAASMRLCEFVVFYGKIREDQMPAWLEQLDIYVHATSGETQSTSIIQAMSMELPVIASNVRGVSNMLGPNDTCGYCVGNRTQDFGNKVLEIIDAPSHALKVAKQARLRVVQGYNHHSMINNYLKIIYSGNI
jgi:glycosyltransferase involved in cell wall biosynthesis